ncbi:MAG: acetoacetate decarboxylase family protein [Frankiaceae bacterium]|nr:acetoacetate decarboxylase family protein [Frankiaceae bacterium]
MTTLPYAVTDAVGLPETRLPEDLLTQLPETVAAAPWHTRDCRVMNWLHPVAAEALSCFPEQIRPTGDVIVAWALVEYGDTPVGPYSEIAATLLPTEGDGYGHIPFIVVDSPASVVGGRANWLLPKALARFDWSEGGHSVTVTNEQPEAPAWSITVAVTPTGNTTALTVPNHIQQVSADGDVRRFDGELNGKMQSATFDVAGQADGPLGALLKSGRFDGTILTDCDFLVGPLNS